MKRVTIASRSIPVVWGDRRRRRSTIGATVLMLALVYLMFYPLGTPTYVFRAADEADWGARPSHPSPSASVAPDRADAEGEGQRGLPPCCRELEAE